MQRTNHKSRVSLATLLVLAGLSATIGTTTGCRGDRSEKPPHRFIPDMDQQPKWNPQSETDFYENGRAQRLPDPNAVAFGNRPFDPVANADEAWAASYLSDRAALLKEGDAFYKGTDPNGPEGWATTMAAEVSLQMLDHGRDKFTTYCTPCHGTLADGKGTVGARWSYSPANLMGDLYKDRAQRQGTDGWLFNVVRNGVWGPDGSNKMPGYAHALSENDAWAVVAYIRALQISQSGTIDQVPASQRDTLLRQGVPSQPPQDQPAQAQPAQGGNS
ncbi:MAG: mono/diheme cytochrome c family protein [Phycisphaerales bacterium]|jgi:mono/diheme cytochrome c family protein